MGMNSPQTSTENAGRPGLWVWIFLLCVAGASVLAGLLVHGHPHFEIDAVIGFPAWFSFLTCLAVVAIVKLLSLVLRRPDTYYEDDHE